MRPEGRDKSWTRCLCVGGIDSAGMAGLAADLRAVQSLGAHASMVAAALTIQTTRGVERVEAVAAELLSATLEAALRDPGADVIKCGLLPAAESVRSLHQALRGRPQLPLVLDPVQIASVGEALSTAESLEALRVLLIPRSRVVTPNRPELERLVARQLADEVEEIEAARELLALPTSGGPAGGEQEGTLASKRAVLITGGHRAGALYDLLVEQDAVHRLEGRRLESAGSRGGGCTHASALAVGIARGLPLLEAARMAQDFVGQSIAAARRPGPGEGRVVPPARWHSPTPKRSSD